MQSNSIKTGAHNQPKLEQCCTFVMTNWERRSWRSPAVQMIADADLMGLIA